MSRGWVEATKRAFAGRLRWVVVVVLLTMLRLLSDLGLGATAATNAYLLTLSGLGMLWCAGRLVTVVSGEPAQNPPPVRAQPERPPRLVSLEDSVTWAARSEHVRDTRLRAEIRFAVADRLGRAGYYLGSHPAAPQLMGPATAALVESTEVAEPGTGRRGLAEEQLLALADELSGLDRRIEQHGDATRESAYQTGDLH